MKNYFLGIFPDQKTNYKIRKIVGEVGRVFSGQGIDVRWINPDNFHVSVIYLGHKLPFLKRQIITSKIKKIKFDTLDISIKNCSLGISRKYKGLVYLSIDKGGDALRDMVYTIRERLGVDDIGQYIPHISIGRVSKELSGQEYQNLLVDLRVINKTIDYSDILFRGYYLDMVESDLVNYKSLKRFPITS